MIAVAMEEPEEATVIIATVLNPRGCDHGLAADGRERSGRAGRRFAHVERALAV
jgi:hypothetical protein